MLLLMISMSLTLTSCFTTRGSKQMNQVELGMTKSDIQNLLGKPFFRNANEGVEEWGYHKMVNGPEGLEEVIFVVSFDQKGHVVAYDTMRELPYFHRFPSQI